MKRIFLAGFLILLVWIVWGAFFVPTPKESVETKKEGIKEIAKEKGENEVNGEETKKEDEKEQKEIKTIGELQVLEIKTNLFTAVLSNELGGTFLQYSLNNKKYKGSYSLQSSSYPQDLRHSYDKDSPVSFLFTKDEGFSPCNPCLGGVETNNEHKIFIGGEELLANNSSINITEKTEIEFKSDDFIHTIIIDPSSYKVLHKYEIVSEKLKNADPRLVWANGTRPSEKYGWLDDHESYGMYVTKNGEDSDYITGNSETEPLSFQNIEWVGSRNKFFVSAVVPTGDSYVKSGQIIPRQNLTFSEKYKYRGSNPSVYDITLDFADNSGFEFYSFLAPQEYSLIKDSGIKDLDDIMTMGGSFFRPISKFILSITNYINNLIPWGGYALVLILFAFVVRIVAGPLTKLSLESTRKMQEVQPIIKDIQEKHKADPKKMQTKIMEAYKNHNVNPLSGCFLMLLQWPIMIPPFILFRSIIELRGEPLFLWIQDLSLPDYIVELPFHIPLIGIGNGYTGIGLLPILMGITLFLTMKQSSGSMPQQNKVMLYTMNGMFVLLFNSFPAGLNLYYVVYNLLNYFQQRRTSQKKDDQGSSQKETPKTPFWARLVKKK